MRTIRGNVRPYAQASQRGLLSRPHAGFAGGARPAFGMFLSLLLIVLLLACFGCTRVRTDDSSPYVVDTQLSSTSDMTESSQVAEVKLMFGSEISAKGDVADDFTFLLNGAPVDQSTIKVDVRASATSVTFSLVPAQGASKGGNVGSYYALYQSAFSIASAREDGALTHITGVSGANAVLDEPITGTLPSGLSLEVVRQQPGSEADRLPAQTTFKVTSPALLRAITWFSPDGGMTKLLKHNHMFASEDASACAEDLAQLVNRTPELHLTASANDVEVTLTATQVVDGQVIEPVVVEGVGIEGGSYDASSDGSGA